MCVKWSTLITNVVHGYVYYYVKLCTITCIWTNFSSLLKKQTYFFAAFFWQLELDLIAARQTV